LFVDFSDHNRTDIFVRQRACKLRLTGVKDELKHIEKELKNLTPGLKKVRAKFLIPFTSTFLTHIKAHHSHNSLKEKSEELMTIVNAAEDAIFRTFCRKIGVSSIREYEERQLKVAQEESQARLRYDTQIARLMNQYVCFTVFCVRE
jgi:structural maintenance of chromosome 1